LGGAVGDCSLNGSVFYPEIRVKNIKQTTFMTSDCSISRVSDKDSLAPSDLCKDPQRKPHPFYTRSTGSDNIINLGLNGGRFLSNHARLCIHAHEHCNSPFRHASTTRIIRRRLLVGPTPENRYIFAAPVHIPYMPVQYLFCPDFWGSSRLQPSHVR